MKSATKQVREEQSTRKNFEELTNKLAEIHAHPDHDTCWFSGIAVVDPTAKKSTKPWYSRVVPEVYEASATKSILAWQACEGTINGKTVAIFMEKETGDLFIRLFPGTIHPLTFEDVKFGTRAELSSLVEQVASTLLGLHGPGSYV